MSRAMTRVIAAGNDNRPADEDGRTLPTLVTNAAYWIITTLPVILALSNRAPTSLAVIAAALRHVYGQAGRE